MILTLLGAPGSGKGTQGRRLADRLGLAYLSSGDLLRSAIAAGTEPGLRARSFLEQGLLVPDDVLIPLVCAELQRVTAPGVVLDGFPRTRDQALALDSSSGGCSVEGALVLKVPDEVAIERLATRLMCQRCGSSFGAATAPPREAGRCDGCGGDLTRRVDDAPETVRQRLAVYAESVAALLAYYRQRGVLGEIDAHAPADHVTSRLLDATGTLARIPLPTPSFQAA